MTETSSKNGIVLYNLIFPFWIFPFIPKLIPLLFLANFAIDTVIIWLYLKRHKKINRPRIYCFRAFGSERTRQPEVNKKRIFSYSFKAALFGYFADFLGGLVMLGLLESPIFEKYIDPYRIWSNFISIFLHILVILIVGFLIYIYHRRMGKRLALDAAEARRLGLVMGILTAPWFFLIPVAWFY